MSYPHQLPQKENGRQQVKIISPSKQGKSLAPCKNNYIETSSSVRRLNQVLYREDQLIKTVYTVNGCSQGEGKSERYQQLKISKYPSTIDQRNSIQRLEACESRNSLVSDIGNTQQACSIKAYVEGMISRYRLQTQKEMLKLFQQLESQQQKARTLQKILDQNTLELKKKDALIEELDLKIKKETKKNEDKFRSLRTELDSFKTYYEHCYDYTLKRISDVEKFIDVLNGQIAGYNQTKIDTVVSEIKKHCSSLAHTCFAISVTSRMESIDRIQAIIEKTDLLDRKINDIISERRLIENFELQKSALCEQIRFFKKTLHHWQDERNIAFENLFELELQEQSYSQDYINDTKNMASEVKRVKFKKSTRPTLLVDTEIKAERLSRKIINLEQSVDNITSGKHRIQIAQLEKAQNLKRIQEIESKLDQKTQEERGCSNQHLSSANTFNLRKYRELSHTYNQMMTDYQNKLQEKGFVIYQLESQLSKNKQILRCLKQEFQNKETEYEEMINMLQNKLTNFQTDLETDNMNQQNRKTTGKLSIISFGTSPKRKGNKFCKYLTTDSRIIEEESPEKASSLKSERTIAEQNEKLKNDITTFKQKIQTLIEEKSQLENINRQLIDQQKRLNQEYEMHVQKFQSQSSTFQNMLKTLRKENKAIYQERENMYKEIQLLKGQNSKPNSINAIRIENQKQLRKHQSTSRYERSSKEKLVQLNQSARLPSKFSVQKKPVSPISRQYQEDFSKPHSSKDVLIQNSICRGSGQNLKTDEIAQEIISSGIDFYHQSEFSKDSKKRLQLSHRTQDSQQSKNNNVFFQTSKVYENSFISKSSNSLKDALLFCGFSLPTPCKVDETGYLKHAYQGTYIMNQKGTLYKLSKENLKEAERKGVILIIR